MKEEISTSIQWQKASRAGIVLGLTSAAYLILSSFLARWSQGSSSIFIWTLLTMLLWSVKFVLCIGLMKYYLVSLKMNYRGVTSREAFRFGVKIALLSAFVYSVFYLANLLYFSNDILDAQWNMVMEQYASLIDSNTLSGMERMKDSIPVISSVMMLIYCFLFGTVLSKLLSKMIIPDEELPDGQPEEQNGNQATNE